MLLFLVSLNLQYVCLSQSSSKMLSSSSIDVEGDKAMSVELEALRSRACLCSLL